MANHEAERAGMPWSHVAGCAVTAVVLIVLLLVIIGVVWFFSVAQSPDETKWSIANEHLLELHKAIQLYQLANGDLPVSLSDVTSHFPDGLPNDPFTGGTYSYTVKGNDFELTCLGSDGRPGGSEPAARDIIFTQVGRVSPP